MPEFTCILESQRKNGRCSDLFGVLCKCPDGHVKSVIFKPAIDTREYLIDCNWCRRLSPFFTSHGYLTLFLRVIDPFLRVTDPISTGC